MALPLSSAGRDAKPVVELAGTALLVPIGPSFFVINEAGYAAVVIFSGENDGRAYGALEKSVMAMTAKAASVAPAEAAANKDAGRSTPTQ